MKTTELNNALKILGHFIRDLPDVGMYSHLQFSKADQTVMLTNGSQAGRIRLDSEVPDLALIAGLLRDLLRGQEGDLIYSSDGVKWKIGSAHGLVRPSTPQVVPVDWEKAADGITLNLPHTVLSGVGWLSDQPPSSLHSGVIATAYGEDLALAIVDGARVYLLVVPGISFPAGKIHVVPDVFLRAMSEINTDAILTLGDHNAWAESADSKVQLVTGLLDASTTIPNMEGTFNLFDLDSTLIEVAEEFRAWLRRCNDMCSYGEHKGQTARATLSYQDGAVQCACDLAVAKLSATMPAESGPERPVEVGVATLYRELSGTKLWADYLSFLRSSSNQPCIQCLTQTDYYAKMAVLGAYPTLK